MKKIILITAPLLFSAKSWDNTVILNLRLSLEKETMVVYIFNASW